MSYTLTGARKLPIVFPVDDVGLRFRTQQSCLMERPARRAGGMMPNMPAKLTRLELAIIVAALVVLLFSNQPPESGNADVRRDIGLTADALEVIPQPQIDPPEPEEPLNEVPATAPTPDITPDNSDAKTISLPPKPSKRIAMVDARKCDSLKYPHVMYGEISVRWVWNGTKLEPRKVCEVRESNGVVTVWSFDEPHEGVTITEIPTDQTATN